MDNLDIFKKSNNIAKQKSKRENKKQYLKQYYLNNIDKWKKGNIYHPKSNKTDINGFKKENKKVIVYFN